MALTALRTGSMTHCRRSNMQEMTRKDGEAVTPRYDIVMPPLLSGWTILVHAAC